MQPLNLSYIKTKNTLQVAEHKSLLCLSIVEKVKEIEKYGSLKFDNELLIFVCSCIENALDVAKKVDKKKIALDIYEVLFEISSDDRAVLSCAIDFLCNNGLVKKVNTLKKYARIMENYIMRKL